jgi:hypothetical protein
MEGAESFRGGIESFGQSTYRDPLHMTNCILKRKSVAPAFGRRGAVGRACAHTINTFKAAKYEVSTKR